jgi:signal transduction histidine kinase/CheY-like chemotaxis protein
MPINDLSQPVSIAGQWQVRPGDDLTWADPQYDTTDWQSVQVPVTSLDVDLGSDNMLWFRVTLQLDTRHPSIHTNLGALGVTISNVMSAYELYAGGQRIGAAGDMPPSPRQEFDHNRVYQLPADAVAANGEVVLALRVWRNPDNVNAWDRAGPYFGEFLVGNVGDLRERLLRKALLPNFVLAVLYLVIGIYHLLIARRNPVLREFFWFGCFSIVLAVYTFESSQGKYLLDVPYWLHKKVEFFALYSAPIFFSQTLFTVIRRPLPLPIRLLLLVFGVFTIAVLIPGQEILGRTLTWFQYLGIVWSILMAGYMSWFAYQGSRSARGIVVLLGLVVLTTVNDVIVPGLLFGIVNTLYLALALMLFFMALVMAERYTEILKKLEQSVEQRTEELVDTNRELTAAVETKGQFLAKMSHELRTPMNAILGLTRLGLKTDLTPQQKDYFLKVEHSAEHLQDIISSVLDFSRLEDGELVVAPVVFDVAQLAGRLKRRWAPVAQESGLEFLAVIDPSVPPRLIGDVRLLEQVLSHLLDNAIKFTSAGEVAMKLVPQVNSDGAFRLGITVRDTGIGIEPDALSGLFESFSQADNSMTRDYGGIGLGLSLASQMLELMNGHIEVTSQPGSGSTFSLELPLEVADADALVELDDGDGSDIDLLPIRGARVLLVDDSDINLQVAGELLRHAQLIVDMASDGQEAVNMTTSCEYDCILMDVQMPVMDGYTATEILRCQPDFADLPILAMTANAMPEDRERGFAAGFNDYIPKPIEPDDLYRALVKWIKPGERAFLPDPSVSAPAADAAELALPESLPGLDIQSGLARVGGNARLYVDLLQDFARHYADSPAQLRVSVASGDTDAAAQLAHKLRGIANNLGANALGGFAETIELTLRKGEALTADSLPQLEASVAEVIASQIILSDSSGELDAETGSLSAAERDALLEELRAALSENNPMAQDQMEALVSATAADAPGLSALKVAADALDGYDFALAISELEAAVSAGLDA